MRQNWLKTSLVAIVAGVFGVVGGVAVAAQFGLGVGAVAETPRATEPDEMQGTTEVDAGSAAIRVNDAGQTYGPIGDGTDTESTPDLILATGNRGTEGYVAAEDLFEPPPSSPAEAVARTKSQPGDRTIPLYDDSGSKVIDTFTIQGTR